MKASATFVIAVLLVGSYMAMVAARDVGSNLAARRAYECVTPPNYWGWKGPVHGDKGQLTDGRTLESWADSQGKPFYSLPSVDGWTALDPVVIVFDLEETRSIGGVGLHSVLSPWGPWWPEAVAVLVSDDNASFHLAGPAATIRPGELAPPLPQEVVQAAIARTFQEKGLSPTTHWFRTAKLEARGRYVSLIMTPPPSTGTIVLDEVEIYEGRSEFPQMSHPDQVFREGKGGWQTYLLFRAVNERLSRDISGLANKTDRSPLASARRQELQSRLRQLDRQRSGMPVPKAQGFRAVLPINGLHREVFKMQAALWRAEGAPALRVWHSHRWDPLSPLDEPRKEEPKVAIMVAENEVRSDVLNISNAGEDDCVVRLAFTGLPSGNLRVFEVVYVDTRSFEPVAAAMVPAEKHGGTYLIDVPSGMTRQVWVRFSSKGLRARKYAGAICLTANIGKTLTLSLPASIEIVHVRLPERFTLRVGGWDYSIDEAYQVTAANRDRFVALLREYGINTTWAGNSVMPLGEYDQAANLAVPPSRGLMDRWLKLWPDASLYCVVLFGTEPLIPRDTLNRLRRIEVWAADWATYLKSRGVPPGQLGILIRDEPTTAEELQTILEVGQAIKKGAPEFKIWNDIHFADPTKAPPILDEVMREACDIQCFNRQHYQQHPEANDAFVAKYQRPGLEWWTYTAGASSRLTDPYVGWLLQEWFCFDKGLTGSHFWAFGDSGGGFSWNEYFASRSPPTPLYLASDSVATSKYMEALREGMQDYELLRRFREEFARRGEEAAPGAERAKQEVEKGVREVLAVDDTEHWAWNVPKDRSAADRVRLRILRRLHETVRSRHGS